MPLNTIIPGTGAPAPTATDPLTGTEIEGIETPPETRRATTEELEDRTTFANAQQRDIANRNAAALAFSRSARETPQQRAEREAANIRLRAQVQTDAAKQMKAFGNLPTMMIQDADGSFREMTDEELGAALFNENLQDEKREQTRRIDLLRQKHRDTISEIIERKRFIAEDFRSEQEISLEFKKAFEAYKKSLNNL